MPTFVTTYELETDLGATLERVARDLTPPIETDSLLLAFSLFVNHYADMIELGLNPQPIYGAGTLLGMSAASEHGAVWTTRIGRAA